MNSDRNSDSPSELSWAEVKSEEKDAMRLSEEIEEAVGSVGLCSSKSKEECVNLMFKPTDLIN